MSRTCAGLGSVVVASARSLLTHTVPRHVSCEVGGAVGELAAALASIAEGQREQGSGLRALAGTVEALRLDLAAGDADSFRSPTGKEYEQLADSKADEFLAVYCGLRVLPASRRGIPATDSAARAPGASEIGAFQWDARFSTTCIPSWSAPVWKVGPFYVYGGGRFQQPPTPDKTRNLSPVKPVQAHYLAVLEYTLCTGWTDEWRSVRGRKVRHSLLPRLEARLHVCVERVREADKAAPTNDVTDAVGVVGVVGQDGCKESVEDLLSHPVCEFKLLKKMFDAGRFVFFFLAPMLPSSSAVFAGSLSAAGGERVAAGGT